MFSIIIEGKKSYCTKSFFLKTYNFAVFFIGTDDIYKFKDLKSLKNVRFKRLNRFNKFLRFNFYFGYFPIYFQMQFNRI